MSLDFCFLLSLRIHFIIDNKYIFNLLCNSQGKKSKIYQLVPLNKYYSMNRHPLYGWVQHSPYSSPPMRGKSSFVFKRNQNLWRWTLRGMSSDFVLHWGQDIVSVPLTPMSHLPQFTLCYLKIINTLLKIMNVTTANWRTQNGIEICG